MFKLKDLYRASTDIKRDARFFIVTILFEINIDDGMIKIKSKFKMNIDIIHHRLYGQLNHCV